MNRAELRLRLTAAAVAAAAAAAGDRPAPVLQRKSAVLSRSLEVQRFAGRHISRHGSAACHSPAAGSGEGEVLNVHHHSGVRCICEAAKWKRADQRDTDAGHTGC